MKKIYTSVLLLLLCAFIHAQQSVGGSPLSFLLSEIENQEFEIREFPSLDLEEIEQEDINRDNSGQLELFSRYIESNLALNNSGTFHVLANGDRVWRLKITAREAMALNFLYDDFHLATNSILHIYSADKSMVLGGFTAANNKSSELFASGNILGESVVLELFEPLSDYGQNRVSIEKIGYVYRNAFAEVNGEFRGGGSGSCEVNVACSEGDSWTDEEKGVVRILLTSNQGQGWCTGSLINNTSLDCVPYILTAWHCGEASSPAQYNQYIYYFNYQTGSCGANSASGTQSITGSTRIAYSNDGGGNSGSDFLLTQIDSDIPSSINAYYNGWNAINTASSSGVGIHHPSGDYKKISTYTSNLVSTSWGSASNSHWRVTWSATENGHGVTEGGSSGSPIFNDDGLIIGQLTGGSSFCNNPTSPDLYGKMSYNWTSNGTQNFERLKLFLDPTNSGLLTLEGTYAPCSDPTISGCTDPEALNYDSEAEVDDGSCVYPCLDAEVTLSFTLDCYGSETSWQLINSSNQVIYEVNENTYSGSEGDLQAGGSSDLVQLCIPAECYTLVLNDSYGDGLFGSQWSCEVDGDLVITDAEGVVLFDLDDPNFGETVSIDFCLDEIDLDDDGFLVSEGDCNDGDDTIYPGAPEICDGVDNNCNGTIDENFIINTYWLDDDNDGFGNPNIYTSSCLAPEGYVSNSDDCDDEDENVNPNNNEICDGKDNNCDGLIDEGFVTSIFFLDSDDDGYGNPNVSVNSCFMPSGYADNDNDCNDANTNINPGMSEVCNNADDDCSGVIDDNLITQIYYEDDDNDSFGNPNVSVEDCSQPNGYVLNSLDCDDTDDDINPNGTEILDDTIDQDCDGSDLVTGISENAISVFNIYPNPAKTMFYINGLTEGQKIMIRDTTGRLVRSLTVKLSDVFSIDVSSLARGAYFINVSDNLLTISQKIILN